MAFLRLKCYYNFIMIFLYYYIKYTPLKGMILIMKLVLAVIGNDDSAMVSSALTKEGFHVTKLATTGGLLKAGNTTFLTGVEDNKVNRVIEIITDYSSERTQIVPSTSSMNIGSLNSFPVEVTVGGATIFVMDIERFEKV